MPSGLSEAGADIEAELERALQDIERLEAAEVVAVHRCPAKAGSWGTWPDRLDPRVRAALAATGRDRPYQHQADAVAAALQGCDVVLSTSTASGKSLAYQVPILDAVLGDPRARALLLFPTKALGRDQVHALRGLAAHVEGKPVGVAVYDGDTPPDERRAARRRAHAVATNPDMLHRGILPHHEGWAAFLAGLRYVVLDELHTYRGLFGSHVACVVRRLLRLCHHYGSSPVFVASSATIANPVELFSALTGRGRTGDDAVRSISRDAAPAGSRTWVVLNPKVVDPATGVRRDYVKVTRSVASVLRQRAVASLVFCRTRKAVELITRYMKDDERAERAPEGAGGTAVRGYRGGYLPERRREVEAALRAGDATLVATTHALELGIDIGGIDAVVLSGYPGTRASTAQRWGRAGRRGRPSLGVLCLSSTPLDQFVGTDPSFLWGTPPEHARVDPDNPEVLLPHLRCAAHEQAFVGARLGPSPDGHAGPCPTGLDGKNPWGGLPAEELRHGLDYLVAHRALVRTGDGDCAVYTVEGGESPAETVDLRGPIEENFSVIDAGTGAVLAEVDFEDAPLYLHVGAIYPIEGRTHEVVDLQWDPRKAFVRAVSATYYTEAICKTRVRVIDPEVEGGSVPASGQGVAHRVRSVPGFKKIRFGTHENIGFGPIALPDLELHTVAAYWRLPEPEAQADAPHRWTPAHRAATALAVAHAIRHVAAMVLMCDLADLGHGVTGGHPGSWGPVLEPGRRPSAEAVLHAVAAPYVVLHDTHPGGAGLASTAHELGAELLDRAAQVVASCRCEQGCPTCMGPASDDAWEVERADVVHALAHMRDRMVSAGGPR